MIDRLGKSRHSSNLIVSGEISSAKQENWRLDKNGAVNSLNMNALPVTGFVFKVSIIAPGYPPRVNDIILAFRPSMNFT